MAGEKPDDGEPHHLYGKDGWSTGGPSDAEIAHAAETRFRQDLQAALERWRKGDLTAFAEAMRVYWRQNAQQFPYELVEASKVLVARAMAEDEKRARREWDIHKTRWEALTELRERRHELNKPRRVRNDDGEITLQRDDRGMTMESAREAVAEVLRRPKRREAQQP